MKKFTDKINESVDGNNLPTAEEFFTSVVGENPDEFNRSIKECMIEFAKLHVEAALKEVKKTMVEYTDKKFSEIDMYKFADYTWKNSPNTHPEYDEEMLERPNETVDNKDSILNSYPLENIK